MCTRWYFRCETELCGSIQLAHSTVSDRIHRLEARLRPLPPVRSLFLYCVLRYILYLNFTLFECNESLRTREEFRFRLM